jgi:hypothetical protein
MKLLIRWLLEDKGDNIFLMVVVIVTLIITLSVVVRTV